MPLFKVLRGNKMEMERSGVTVKGVRKVMKQDRNPKKEQPFQKAARLAIKSRFEPFDAEERLRDAPQCARRGAPPAAEAAAAAEAANTHNDLRRVPPREIWLRCVQHSAPPHKLAQ